MANPNPVTTWHKGMKSANPTGRSLPERLAARTIAEAIRDVLPGPDLARILLALAAGVDPFARPADASSNPDGLPTAGAVPLDWTHRMAALKMLAEYGYGKPLQGIHVEAQVRQETVIREERTAVVELRAIAERSPAARDALRTIARAMLAPSSGGDHAARGRAEVLARPAHLDAQALEVRREHGDDDPGDAAAGDDPEEAELDVGEDGDGLEDLHDDTVRALAGNVNGEEKKTRVPGVAL